MWDTGGLLLLHGQERGSQVQEVGALHQAKVKEMDHVQGTHDWQCCLLENVHPLGDPEAESEDMKDHDGMVDLVLDRGNLV